MRAFAILAPRKGGFRRSRSRSVVGDIGARAGSHLVVEVSVEAQDVRVSQVRLDLDLPSQLVLHVRLLELVLEQHFQRDDVLASLLARQVHVAELAAAQRLTDVEVAYLFIVGSGGRRCRASG